MNSRLCKTMRWFMLSALLIPGCAMTEPDKKHCRKPLKLTPVDWIMVSGTSLPATTVVIGECGLSLADSLTASHTIEKLASQSEAASEHPVANKLTDSEVLEVFSIFKNKADNAETFDSAVSFVAEFIQSRPWLDIPPDWYRGFPDSAFDKNIGTERDRQLIAAQIQELNPMLRMEATKHFQGLTKAFTDEKLKDGSVSQTTKESEKFLKVLAQDGRLNVGDYQKLKSWCYANGSSKHESETESEAISSSFKIKSTVPAIGDEPATEMMMVIVHRGSRCVVVPLPLVFESTFGGYWVEPGDHLFLARFKELPFRVQWDNLNDSKKVGITGMIASQGVWPTETRSLESVISSFRSDIDNGADMMLVAQVHNNMVFECMLPLSMTSLSAGRITQMASLVREWGLVDGQVVSFQNSGLSPLLVASTEKLRRATDLRRRLLADNSKLCQQVPPGDLPCYSSVSESTKVNASRITLANDTCNTFQDSLKSLRDITSNTLNKLPLRGN